MKLKVLAILLIILSAVSCGKKSITAEARIKEISKVQAKDDAIEKEPVNEHNCIDTKLTSDLDSGESIKKNIINNDFNFCNGVRVRLKTYEFDSKKYKAYGFVLSNSGYESCLTESKDLNHKAFLGDQGVLEGTDIKILIGGHQLDANNQLIPSDHRLSRYVKFPWGSYNGELALYEKGKIRCWAIQ